jgi:TolB protein
MTLSPRRRLLVLGGTLAAVWAGLLYKPLQVAAQDDTSRDIVISNPNREKLKIAVMDAGGAEGADSARIASKDFDLSSYFKVLLPSSFTHLQNENFLTAEPSNWRAVGAQALSKGRAAGGQLEFKLFLPEQGAQPVLSRTFPGGSSTRASTHRWVNLVIKKLTGEEGIFGSQIAVTGGGPGQKNIYVLDSDGYGLRRVTNGKLNILPSWAPGGGGLLFTTYAHLNPDLYFVSLGGGRARRISSFPGLNTGGVYSPDGGRIAVTLSKDGNSEIYILSSTGQVLNRVTTHPAIDSDPNWSPDGQKLAFVSDRAGGPQIFVVSASGGAPQRVTWQGNYNTTPRWNPRRDVQQLAYTGRDERAHFDVFVIDLGAGNKVERTTQSKGDNLEPTWAPNGRLLAYTSSRGGLYLATPDGKHERRLVTGRFQTPSWGPVRRQ